MSSANEIHANRGFTARCENGGTVDRLSETLAKISGWNDWLVTAPKGR